MIQFRPLPWLTVATVIALVCLVALGNWQVRRLAWKTDLIEAVNSRSTKPAQPLSQVLADSSTLEDTHFARVYATGRFQHDLSVYLFTTQGELGVGYFVITPLELSGGGHLLVNRGFVPKDIIDNDLIDRDNNTYQKPNGGLSVEGLVRLPDPPGSFTPDPDISNSIWYSRDLDGMAGAMRLADIEPVFVDIVAGDDPNTWPRAGLTRVSFSNNHLGYALTWYGLAIALIAVYIAYHINSGRLSWGRRRSK